MISHAPEDYVCPFCRNINEGRADLPLEIALKTAFDCDGVSTRQHNEPAGNQDVRQYHLHIFPRYEADGLYAAWPSLSDTA